MEYILVLLLAVLGGLVLNRKLPQAYRFWGKIYWGCFGIGLVQSLMFAPYRFFRVWYDLGRLFQ